MNLTQVNKIMAEACGVEPHIVDEGRLIDHNAFVINGKIYSYAWTIEDARCREIIREKFKVETLVNYSTKNWFCSDEFNKKGEGKTIAEAEKACITAICKQMESDDG